MTKKSRQRFAGLALWIVLVAVPGMAHAVLGEHAVSVEAGRQTLSAVRGASMAHRHYTVYEIRTDATAVREYVSADGIVFAVAWNGLVHPDLTALLGSYADEYEAALRSTPREQGRRQSQVKTNRVVVEKWGHVRNLQGRAYAPDLVPPGVSIDEIR